MQKMPNLFSHYYVFVYEWENQLAT